VDQNEPVAQRVARVAGLVNIGRMSKNGRIHSLGPEPVQGALVMSTNSRAQGFSKFVCACAAGFVPFALVLLNPARNVAYGFAAQYGMDQDPAQMPNFWPFGQDFGDDANMPRRNSRMKTAKKKAKTTEKDKGSAKKGDTSKSKGSGKSAGNANSDLVFSQDIAPILVANCIRCHSRGGEGVTKGKLDLSTFAKLQTGTGEEQVIIAGKPAESRLVLRIKGEETPRMPAGNAEPLSADAIARIERWVKEGAKADPKVDRMASMESYAASPEQVRRRQVAKLPPAERDKTIEAIGRQRWKAANAKLNPELTTGDRDHFVVFSNLAKEKATALLRAMEAQYGHMRRLLGTAATDWPEKVSIYVFVNKKDFIEFVRSVETRDLDADEVTSAKLMVPQPYVAVLDPSGGRKEEPAPRKKGRGKRGEAKDLDGGGSDRSLIGLLVESVDSAIVAAAGSPPRWLSKGIGTYMASHAERSPYYNQLRQAALANFDQGWQTKANEALGGAEQIAPGDLHAIGFALVDAMLSTELRANFPAFVNGMLEGPAKLDEVLKTVYGGATRDDFINNTGDWMVGRYRNGQGE
jgi:hypothetical protein